MRALTLIFTLFIASALAPRAQPPAPNNLLYEIFVRSFADGDNDARGIGDLQGIISRLDTHLNDGSPATDHDLEVGILWLMPIFPSPTYHGYDVTNFRTVNPEYGTLADFQALVAQAHRRGVRVILDVPFNHTSDRHPWFREALDNASSSRRRFFHIEADSGGPRAGWHSTTNASGDRLRYQGVFSPRMPDLNLDNPEVRKEVDAIAKFWLALGADGFRLDAAKHVYGDTLEHLSEDDILKNNAWWREFSHGLYRVSRGAVLIGEVLGGRETLRRHSWGLDALLDEPFMEEVRAAVGGPGEGLVGRHRQFVEDARALNRMAYDSSLPFPDQPFQSYAFVASHDRNPRLASYFEDRKRGGMSYSVDEAYRMALYMLLTIPSHPVLYAGDEVMQRGWKWNGNPPDHRENPGDGSRIYDETLREPFPWTASGQGTGQTRWFQPRFDFANDGVSLEEQGQPGRILDLVRAITNLRTRHAGFATGDIGAIASDSSDWMVFERVAGSERYLVLINRSMTGRDYRFHEAWFPQYRGARLVFWSDGRQRTWRDLSGGNENIGDSVFVPPVGLVVLRQR